jgi:hypothetical protein
VRGVDVRERLEEELHLATANGLAAVVEVRSDHDQGAERGGELDERRGARLAADGLQGEPPRADVSYPRQDRVPAPGGRRERGVHAERRGGPAQRRVVVRHDLVEHDDVGSRAREDLDGLVEPPATRCVAPAVNVEGAEPHD